MGLNKMSGKVLALWVCAMMVVSPLAVLVAVAEPDGPGAADVSEMGLGGLWNPAGPTESATCHIVEPGAILASHPGEAPSAVDNSAGLPPVGNQGGQGSCTAWAIGYYHTTYIENRESTIDITSEANQTSPSFLYNLANGGYDGGSYMDEVADLLISNGACSMAEKYYSQYDHVSWPEDDWIWVSGMKRRAASQNWLDLGSHEGMEALKAHLAAGNTATTAIEVYSNFDNIELFNNTYSSSEVYGTDRGGHIVTICGYDDDMVTADGFGAFRMVNSWGLGWGDAGYWWMTYEAIVDPVIAYGWAMYLESLANYKPSAVAKVQIDHEARGDVTRSGGLVISLFENGTYPCDKTLLDCPWIESWYGDDYQEYPFPSGEMAFDITEMLGYMDPNSGHGFTVASQNNGGFAGEILEFEILNAAWWEGNYSNAVPVALDPWGYAQADTYVHPGVFTHLPIRVDSDEMLAHSAIGEFWEGDGAASNPYVIHDYDIDGAGMGGCVYIANATSTVSIEGCALHGASGGTPPYEQDAGIILDTAFASSITGNTIYDNDNCGISVQLSSYIIILGNDICGNGLVARNSGVYVTQSSPVVISGNNLVGNCIGVFLDESHGANVEGNNASWNEDAGIWLDKSDNGTVSGNRIEGNNYGIVLSDANGNTIYHNSLIENAVQALDDGANSWDVGYPTLTEVLGEVAVPAFHSDIHEYASLAITEDDKSPFDLGTIDGWLSYMASANFTFHVNASDLQALDVQAIGDFSVPDLDLGIFLDGGNGQPLDGVCQWEEFLTQTHVSFDTYGSSGTYSYCYCADSDAYEAIRIHNPLDGHYFIKVVGFDVTGGMGSFDLRVDEVRASSATPAHGNIQPGSMALEICERSRVTAYWNGENHTNCVHDMDGSESAPWGFDLPSIPNFDQVILSYYDDAGTPEDKADDEWASFEAVGFVEGVDYQVNYGTGYISMLTINGWTTGYVLANYSHVDHFALAEGVDYIVDYARGVLTFPAPISWRLWNVTVNYNFTTPGGGNYWSDYAGADEYSGPLQDEPGADGYGDTPYVDIQGGAGALDNYPLMAPWAPTMPDTTPPAHFDETPVGESSNLTPVVSVRVTDVSGVDLSSVRLYVDGFPLFTTIEPVADGFVVWYWHEMGFEPATNHSCRIVADDTLGNRLDFTWYFATPPPYNVPVTLGWNLLSVPLDLFDASLPGALMDSDTTWDRIMAYNASDALDPWKQYNTAWAPSLNDLASLDCLMGFWLHVTAVGDGNLTVCGSDPGATVIQLRVGWNLVGYPTQAPRTVAEAFWGTTADIVEVFDPDEPYMTVEAGAGYVMTPNKGYWVHVLADTVWYVDW